jgi:vesicle transport through interaction with t-SNAREs protein 1
LQSVPVPENLAILGQIKSMDMEARSLPPTVAQPLLTKVKDYKADLTALKEQMKKAQTASPVGDAARAELVRGFENRWG